jgi:hypothetical protein
MVRDMVAYLVRTVDRDPGVWPIIGPEVDAAPHAPWWNFGPDLAATWNGFRFNPTADLLGTLIDYAELVPPDLLRDLQARMLANVRATDTLAGGTGRMFPPPAGSPPSPIGKACSPATRSRSWRRTI